MMLRRAILSELPSIWKILQQAIEQRRLDGSEQWQDGYPNEQSITEDINSQCGYVLVDGDTIIAYAAIIFGEEPTYSSIEGAWLTSGSYVVVHRLAVSNDVKGKGIATEVFKMLEGLCLDRGVFSIKVDTNFDNIPMLKILEKLGYTYCGEVYYRGAPRRAFEKVLHLKE